LSTPSALHHLGVRLLLAFGLPLLAWLVGRAWLLDPAHFPLRNILISGEMQRVTQAELRAAVSPFEGEGFFGLDLEALRGTLRDLPWVRDAEVSRQWPDAVNIRVYEQQPLATWGAQDLINQAGERFSVPAQPDGLPRLSGPEGYEAQTVDHLRGWGGELQAVGLSLSELTLDERLVWHLTLANGLQVTLGREELEQRMARLVQAYPRLLAHSLQKIERVDLRYPNGLAIAWRAGQMPQTVGAGEG